jgi:hypothetical protein
MYRALLLAFILVITGCNKKPAPKTQTYSNKTRASEPPVDLAGRDIAAAPLGYTNVFLHGIRLRDKAGIRFNVSWLRGRMYPAQKGVTPLLDDPQSFTLDVQDGLISVALPDVAKLLNSRVLKGSSLANVKLAARGDQLQINGTLHKVLPLPIQALASVAVSPDGQQIVLHIAKVQVLKMPVGGLLKALDVKPAELIDASETKGIHVDGNDVAMDTTVVLPPPRNTGKLASVHISKNDELVEVFGTPKHEINKFEQYRNFIRLSGGTTQIGKLTMVHTDILLVDTSQGDLFDFDLGHFPEQLVNGYARLTPQAGLRIFIPDSSKIPKTAANDRIDVEWVKNRNVAPPPDVP